MSCKNTEKCPVCGHTHFESPGIQDLPYMCCTCNKWDPHKNNIERGQCSVIGTGITDFDHSCGNWDSCEITNEKA